VMGLRRVFPAGAAAAVHYTERSDHATVAIRGALDIEVEVGDDRHPLLAGSIRSGVFTSSGVQLVIGSPLALPPPPVSHGRQLTGEEVARIVDAPIPACCDAAAVANVLIASKTLLGLPTFALAPPEAARGSWTLRLRAVHRVTLESLRNMLVAARSVRSVRVRTNTHGIDLAIALDDAEWDSSG
jgi:hypothetical protein